MDGEPAKRPAELNEGQPEKLGENPTSSDPSGFRGSRRCVRKGWRRILAGVVKPLNHNGPSGKRKLIFSDVDLFRLARTCWFHGFPAHGGLQSRHAIPCCLYGLLRVLCGLPTL